MIMIPMRIVRLFNNFISYFLYVKFSSGVLSGSFRSLENPAFLLRFFHSSSRALEESVVIQVFRNPWMATAGPDGLLRHDAER